jgi:hypothetical protein
MTVYREFSIYLDAAKPEEFPHIGDKFEVIKMEDMEDEYRGQYILVSLAPVQESSSNDEIAGVPI